MISDYLAQYRATLVQHKARMEHDRQKQQEGEAAKPTEAPPLLDQLRALLATWPPSQTERLSLPILIPHLKGKHREIPNAVGIARCLKILGYRKVRSWRKEDEGCRYWVKV